MQRQATHGKYKLYLVRFLRNLSGTQCIHALHRCGASITQLQSTRSAVCRQNAVRKEAAFAVRLNHFHGFLGANVGKEYCYTNDTIFVNDILCTNFLAIIRVYTFAAVCNRRQTISTCILRASIDIISTLHMKRKSFFS